MGETSLKSLGNVPETGKKWKESKSVRSIRSTRLFCGIRVAGKRYRANPFPYICVGIILYRLTLDLAYMTLFNKYYGYEGFTVDPSPMSYICSFLALILAAPVVARINMDEKPSSLIMTALNYIYFIPFTSYCGCKGTGASFLLSGLIYWVVLLLLQLTLPVLRLKKLKLRHANLLYSVITAFSVILIMYISGRYAGFRFTLDFINVYGIRSEFAQYDIPTMLGYFLSFMSIVLPILLLYWTQKRNYVVVGILIIVNLFYFSLSAQKSIFLLLGLVFGVYLLYRKWIMESAGPLLTGGVIVSCLCVVPEPPFLIPMFLLIQRMLYLPVQVSEKFWEFFRNNPLNLFRDGLMRWFGFSNNYTITIPRVIGESWGYPQANTNSGLLGDMYASLPVVTGVLLMPLLLILCFRLLDMATKDLPPKITASVAIYCAISFMSVTWSSALLSNGILVACLLLYLYPVQEGKEKTLV